MNQIQQLINQMCPNGVEWKTLGEVCEMQRGTSLTKANSVEGEYPVISGGREPAFYCNQYNRDGETITIAGSGAGAGFVQYWNQKIFVNDAFSIKGKENLFTRYLYYCLRNLQEQIYATKKGGGVPHVHISDVKDFQLPIPPLAIQTRIVEILDHFTNLTANLTAELNLRRKQFEHYREKLLSLDGVEGVEWKKLGEVAEIGTGSRNTIDGKTEGLYPFYTRGQEVLRLDNYDFDETSIITAGDGAGVGKTFHFVVGKYALHQRAYRIVPRQNIVNAKFLYYYIRKTFYDYIMQNSVFGSVPSVRRPKLMIYPVPVPPIATQHSIVSILDKFTALIENIEKELALRQKQYEYYREELLRFGG